MIFRSMPIHPDWLPAYEESLRAVEKQIALASGWLLLGVMVVYQLSHSFRNVYGTVHVVETVFRTLVLLPALLTVISHYTKKPDLEPCVLIRAMALAVMTSALSLFIVHALYSPATLYQMSNVLVIAFFGVSILSLRGLRQWWVFFGVPLLLFFAAMPAFGLSITANIPFLFEPLVMVFLGLTVSVKLSQLRRSEFLARQQLKSLASTDQLTGLLNRHAVHSSLNQLAARNARHGHPFSLILGDLDKFKRVNDSYGHNVGDGVLKEAAHRLQNHVRTDDIVCRWGGEELLIVLPDTGLDSALAVAQKLRTAIGNAAIVIEGTTIEQTISLGVATYRDGENIDSTITRADSGLYLAKQGGRNRVMSVEPGAEIIQT